MAIINFNRKLVGLLKDYIVNQHNYIKELEQALKENGYNKPHYNANDRSKSRLFQLMVSKTDIEFDRFIDKLK